MTTIEAYNLSLSCLQAIKITGYVWTIIYPCTTFVLPNGEGIELTIQRLVACKSIEALECG